MNVLVVGGGGREHAIAWKLRQSPRLTDLHVAPGNAGTAEVANNIDLPIPKTGSSPEQVEGYLEAAARLARDLRADLVFVAPDDPLAWGLVDRIEAAGIGAFGPSRAAAELEGSKAWAKGFMARHRVPHARSAIFDDAEAAKAYVRRSERSLVIKADGLAAGKGAIVTASADEALAAVDDLMLHGVAGSAGHRIVIEDRLDGRETSPHAFSDGRSVRAMPLSCDHKPVFDGNRGPNTGGMGVYSPPPWVDGTLEAQVHARITEATIAGMAAEGRPFRGILYPNLMITEAGPHVLEINTRFGDPEAQALLPRLQSDLLEVCWAVVNRRLHEVPVEWDGGASVCVVLASEGYPGPYETGHAIRGIDAVDPEVRVFHAGTRMTAAGPVTAGGRVLSVVAAAPTLAEARERAYANVGRIHFRGVHYRRDIGAL